jgi:hypothetical protein
MASDFKLYHYPENASIRPACGRRQDVPARWPRRFFLKLTPSRRRKRHRVSQADRGADPACQPRQGLPFSQGMTYYVPLRRDRRERLEELQTGDGRILPDHLKPRVRRELDRLERFRFGGYGTRRHASVSGDVTRP